MGRELLTVVVLAQDEEPYIRRCVESALRVADEVLIVDSGSADRTRAVAEAAGARVVDQEWLGYSRQRNRGAELASHDWIFQLDADEVLTATLEDSIRRALAATPDPRDAFTVDRRTDFLGALLPNETRRRKRRSFVRLYHRRHSGYDPEQIVHEEVRVPGAMHPLDGLLLHWRGEGIDEIAHVFNAYANIEAEAHDRAGRRARAWQVLARPLARFVWVYVWRGSWRLGARGLIWAMLKAYNEYLQYAKLWERQNVPRRVVDPPERVRRR